MYPVLQKWCHFHLPILIKRCATMHIESNLPTCENIKRCTDSGSSREVQDIQPRSDITPHHISHHSSGVVGAVSSPLDLSVKSLISTIHLPEPMSVPDASPTPRTRARSRAPTHKFTASVAPALLRAQHSNVQLRDAP